MVAERISPVALWVSTGLLVALVPGVGEAREFRRRTVTITDAREQAVPVLHVAPGVATVIAFQSNVRSADFLRNGDALFQPITRTLKTVVIVPNRAVAKPATLSVAMADGTLVSFALVTAAREVDAQVDVTIALPSAPDSPEALGSQVKELEAKLEECKGASERAGARRIAALILAQGGDAPQAFETHPIRGIERESQLRLEAKRVYRLLQLTYVVLTVDNRDPQRNWVLARAVVRLTGAGQNTELAVEAQASELEELPPDKEERVVVAFKTPQALPDQRISIALLEKDGMRRAELKGLEF